MQPATQPQTAPSEPNTEQNKAKSTEPQTIRQD